MRKAIALVMLLQGSRDLPDPVLTPGDIIPGVTADSICVPGYAGRHRSVSVALKDSVYREYGITHRAPREYEIDHKISLELGGSNSIKNLWPQSYMTVPYNAHVKDSLENRLHAEVCTHQITLEQAQKEINTNWIEAYNARFEK